MSDDRRKRDELGSAPTTPGPPPSPDSTLDMPAGEGGNAAEPGPGAAIGRFIVRARIGAGGMGVVYAGEDADLKRPVAIKLVRGDEQPAVRARLVREAQAMARLEHDNVVRVYEVGTSGGRTFVAMELVEGETLSKWLTVRRTWREVLAMFAQAGAGLSAAHRAGLIHRDFKPDNVLVDRSGRPRVADFGLARIEEPAAAPLTHTGAMMGTPGYMAPEQMFGASDIDARADQYSFCVALREALAGRPLEEARWREVPPPVRAAISRGLAYDRDERFATLDDLLVALREASSVRKREARWPIALAAIAVLGISSGVVAYVSSHRSDGAAAQAPQPVVARAPDPVPIRMPDVPVRPPDEPVRAPDKKIETPRITTRAPRDAGAVAIAPSDATAVAIVAAAPGAPPGLHVLTPKTKGWPVAKPGAPGHMDVVRAAIRDLGYDGVDLAAFDRSPADMQRGLETEIAASTGAAQQIARTKLGMLQRRRGDCKAALESFEDPHNALTSQGTPDEVAWQARSYLGFALCKLAAGDANGAYPVVLKAWMHGDRDEATLVMAFARYEEEVKDEALAHILTSMRSKNPRVQAALKKWFDGLGLSVE